MSALTSRGLLLAGLFALVSCKTASPEGTLQEATPFSSSHVVDLTRYDDADETLFDQMRGEMSAHHFNYTKYRAIVEGLEVPTGVYPDELVAIRLYTSSAYRKINKALRTRAPSELPQYQAIIKAAASGLNKIPSSPCTARRGTSLPEEVLDGIEEDKRFIERAFLSTTYAPEIPIAFQKDITFIIESDKCAKIDWLSEFPTEKEVLFPPGSEFLVTSKKSWVKDGKTHTEIRMRHVMSEEEQTPEPISTAGVVGSPGTAATVGLSHTDFIDRNFISDDDQRILKFRSDRKLKSVNASGDKDCRWEWKDGAIETRCGESTWHFLAFAKDKLGRISAPGSTEVIEYYRSTSASSVATATEDVQPDPLPTQSSSTPQAESCKMTHQFSGGSYVPVNASGVEIYDHASLKKFYDEYGYVKLVEERGGRPWGLRKERCEAALAKQKNGVICSAGLAFNIFRVSDGKALGGNSDGYAIPPGAEDTAQVGFDVCQDMVAHSTPTHVCVFTNYVYFHAVRISDGKRLKGFKKYDDKYSDCYAYIQGL